MWVSESKIYYNKTFLVHLLQFACYRNLLYSVLIRKFKNFHNQKTYRFTPVRPYLSLNLNVICREKRRKGNNFHTVIITLIYNSSSRNQRGSIIRIIPNIQYVIIFSNIQYLSYTYKKWTGTILASRNNSVI